MKKILVFFLSFCLFFSTTFEKVNAEPIALTAGAGLLALSVATSMGVTFATPDSVDEFLNLFSEESNKELIAILELTQASGIILKNNIVKEFERVFEKLKLSFVPSASSVPAFTGSTSFPTGNGIDSGFIERVKIGPFPMKSIDYPGSYSSGNYTLMYWLQFNSATVSIA